MKRRDILKNLKKAGFDLREGGNHTKVYKDGVYVSAVSRQSEIAEPVVRAIERQTGTKLK